MELNDEKYTHIENAIATQFNTFGGGQENTQNLLGDALKDKPLMFALGVDVGDVVKAVIMEYLRMPNADLTPPPLLPGKGLNRV